MNYVVLDLEWNMAFNRKYVVTEPFKLNGEIIQIGAVKLNDELEVVDEFDRMVKPVFYTKMNREVHEITLFTEEDLEKGCAFQEAVDDFRKWCGDDCVWLTWGMDDIYVMQDNLGIHGLDYKWIPESFNAQVIFDDLVMEEGRNYALSYAIWKLDIKAFPAHNALNDARNTATVLKGLDIAGWIEEEREEYLSPL